MHQYWSECANTLIKIENLLVKARDTTCASENFNVKMISYSKTFRIFGEMATLKDNGKKLKGKLKARDLTAVFMGYADNNSNNVFRFVILKTKKIIDVKLIYRPHIKMQRQYSKTLWMNINSVNLADLYWQQRKVNTHQNQQVSKKLGTIQIQ